MKKNCQLDETLRISIDRKFDMMWGGSTAHKRRDEETVLLNLEIRPRRMQIPEVIIVQVLASHENRNPRTLCFLHVAVQERVRTWYICTLDIVYRP